MGQTPSTSAYHRAREPRVPDRVVPRPARAALDVPHRRVPVPVAHGAGHGRRGAHAVHPGRVRVGDAGWHRGLRQLRAGHPHQPGRRRAARSSWARAPHRPRLLPRHGGHVRHRFPCPWGFPLGRAPRGHGGGDRPDRSPQHDRTAHPLPAHRAEAPLGTRERHRLERVRNLVDDRPDRGGRRHRVAWPSPSDDRVGHPLRAGPAGIARRALACRHARLGRTCSAQRLGGPRLRVAQQHSARHGDRRRDEDVLGRDRDHRGAAHRAAPAGWLRAGRGPGAGVLGPRWHALGDRRGSDRLAWP